jgi:hypothetical protein
MTTSAASRRIIACADCGTVLEDATALVDELNEEIALRDRELGQARVQIARLRKAQSKGLEHDPRYAEAQDVLNTWRLLCAPKAKELGGKRLRVTLERLHGGYSAADLSLCVVGYSRFPYVVDAQRSAVGSPDQRYVDPETIFATPKRVEKGMELAAADARSYVPGSLLTHVPWRSVWRANRKLIVDSLTAEFGGAVNEDGVMMWPCPRCREGIAPLRVFSSPGGRLAVCSACGLSDEELIKHVVRD